MEWDSSRQSRSSYRASKRPTGTLPPAILNLINTIVGAGILGLPWAFAKSGWALATIILAIAAVVAWFTLRLLIFVAAHNPHVEASFSSCAKMTYPRLVVLFDISVIINCLGIVIGYLIAIGDFMPTFFIKLAETIGREPFADVLYQRWLWVTVAVLLLIPLSASNELNSLTYISMAALSSATYIVIIIIYFFLATTERPLLSSLHAFRFTPDLLDTIPIFIFAFCCHPNIFIVYNELKISSSHRISSIINTSVWISFTVYTVVGVAGYFTFGEATLGDILANYNSSMSTTMARLAVSILVFLSAPLYIYPCRLACESLIDMALQSLQLTPKFDPRIKRHPISFPDEHDTSQDESDFAKDDEDPSLEQESLLHDEEFTNRTDQSPLLSATPNDHVGHSPKFPRWVTILLALAILLLSWIAALGTTRLDQVLAIIRSTGSTSFVFLFPGLFFYKISLDLEGLRMHRWTAVVLIVIGVLIGIACVDRVFTR